MGKVQRQRWQKEEQQQWFDRWCEENHCLAAMQDSLLWEWTCLPQGNPECKTWVWNITCWVLGRAFRVPWLSPTIKFKKIKNKVIPYPLHFTEDTLVGFLFLRVCRQYLTLSWCWGYIYASRKTPVLWPGSLLAWLSLSIQPNSPLAKSEAVSKQPARTQAPASPCFTACPGLTHAGIFLMI